MHQHSHDMKSCIEACQRCYATCLQTAMQHCLDVGGKHTEPEHFRLMMACAEVCRASAALMLIGSEHHAAQCELCAKICEDCATRLRADRRHGRRASPPAGPAPRNAGPWLVSRGA